jgi:hypothetical protein
MRGCAREIVVLNRNRKRAVAVATDTHRRQLRSPRSSCASPFTVAKTIGTVVGAALAASAALKFSTGSLARGDVQVIPNRTERRKEPKRNSLGDPGVSGSIVTVR